MDIQLLGISGSLRRQSRNSGLLRAARERLPANVHMEIADLTAIPFYNADLQAKPDSVVKLLEQIKSADAYVFACPEYNYSIAPALKNALDWASREPGNGLLADKSAAIMGAGGRMGTGRAQYHLRQVCVFLNLHVLNTPEIFSNANSDAFDADGNPVDPQLLQRIEEQMTALANWVKRLRQ